MRVQHFSLDKLIDAYENSDYIEYSQLFSKDVRKILTKSVFLAGNKKIKYDLGKYISREYLGFLKENEMTVFLWKAQFTKTQNDVLVRLTLSKQNGKNMVMGFYY